MENNMTLLIVMYILRHIPKGSNTACFLPLRFSLLLVSGSGILHNISSGGGISSSKSNGMKLYLYLGNKQKGIIISIVIIIIMADC